MSLNDVDRILKEAKKSNILPVVVAVFLRTPKFSKVFSIQKR